MGVKVGRLDRRVIIMANNPTPTASGGSKDGGWSSIASTRGYLRKTSGNKAASFGDIMLGSTHELFVRFQQSIKDNMRADNRILIDDERTFKVSSFEFLEEERRWIKINLTELTK
jgi:head-tail adaptor